MTKDVEMEGVECQPKECGLSPTQWVVSKGTRKKTSIYISQHIHFTWIDISSLNLEGIGVKQLQL